MSYKILYTPEASHRYPQRKKSKPINWGNLLLLTMLVFTAAWFRLNGIPDFLIPGDPEVTKTAAAEMMAQTRIGESVSESVTVFCKEILNGAGYKSIY